MNHSNASIECYEDWWRTLASRLGYAIYCVLPPIYLIVGLFGNTALILTCLQKHNNESPYFYQVLVAASRGLLIVCHTFLLVVADGLGNVAWPTPDWWTECYACIWVSAHFSVALAALPLSIEPMVTIAMLYDRYVALRKPMAYVSPTIREYAVVSIGSVLVGLGFGAVQFVRFYVVPGQREGTFDVAVDAGWFYVLVSYLRNALIVVQLIASYALNSAICYLYFKRIREVKGALTSLQEMKKRTAAKELLITSITQASFESLQQLVTFSFLVYYNTAGGPCYHVYESVAIEVYDLIVVLTTIGEFYILCAIRPRFRKDAMKLLRKSNGIVPT